MQANIPPPEKSDRRKGGTLARKNSRSSLNGGGTGNGAAR